MKFLHEFSRYGNGVVLDNGWWKISENGKYLENRSGGYHGYTPREDDIIVEVDDWDDLDYSYLLKPDSPYGWIDRDGKFYGCDYRHHNALAIYVFRKDDEEDLIREGWVKVYRDFQGKICAYYDWSLGVRGRLTEAQEKTLDERNIEHF